jgi:hypothetical protein
MKSMDASIKGDSDKIEEIKKKYLSDLKSSIEGKEYDLKSMKEIWDSVLNIAKNCLEEIKKESKFSADNNQTLIKLKKDVEDLKSKKEKGEIEQDQYVEEIKSLRNKAIGDIKSSEAATLSEYAKACGLLYSAIEKFKEGALLEVKDSSKKDLEDEYDRILLFISLKKGDDIKTTKDRAKGKKKKEEDYYEKKEEKDKKEIADRIKSYDAGATGGAGSTGGNKPSKIKTK